jgi:NADP-dependent 3-hydroxy acid dehydrogenase YdfG
MDSKNCEAVVEKHLKEYGRLDILVNNASKQIMSESVEEIDVS